MNASGILEAARSAGFTINVVGGKLSVRGVGDRQPDLVEAIRANKSQIMALIESGHSNEANKAGELVCKEGIQQADLARPGVMPCFPPHERVYLIDKVMRQGEVAIGWCLGRANAYFGLNPASAFLDQEAAAAWDYLTLIGGVGMDSLSPGLRLGQVARTGCAGENRNPPEMNPRRA